MYTLLIVYNDEHHSFLSELNSQWKRIGINTVHEAFSTEEALSIIKMNPIDILVIHDNSKEEQLELLRWIRSFANYISCVVITEDRQYKFLNEQFYRVEMPFAKQDLFFSVEQVIQTTDEKWNSIIYKKRQLNTLEDHLLILQKYFFRGRIKEKLLTSEQFSRSVDILQISDAINAPICLLLIRIDDQLGQFNLHNTSLFEIAIYNMLKELFPQQYNLFYCIDDYDYMVVMVSCKETLMDSKPPFEPIERLMLQLQHYAQHYLSISLSVLISKTGIFPDDLSTIYDNAVNTFRQKIANDREVIMKETEISTIEEIQHLTSLYSPPMLIHLLEAGQWNKVVTKLDTIFIELNTHWSDSHEHLLETYFHIAGAFSNFVHRNNQLMKDVLKENYRKMLNLEHFHTITQVQQWAYETVVTFKNAQISDIQNSRSALVKKVHDFVQDHIDKSSLQSISTHLNLNQSYLSKLYKDETGENLSEYLYRIRMQRAALLLKQTDIKVYEVAQELGYFKVSYFIKLFRDYHGLTPQKFREHK